MAEQPRQVTRESVKATAQQAGIELSDERADALIPQLQGVLNGLDQMREAVDLTDIEPAAVFHPQQE